MLMGSISTRFPVRSSLKSLKPSAAHAAQRSYEAKPNGFATRTMLLGSLALVVIGTTAASLSVLRARLHRQVERDFSNDLHRSIDTFSDLRRQRMLTLQHENALLADLPSLKALMTTQDVRTIVDGGAEFWKVSGDDLFALATPGGKVIAAYATGTAADTRLAPDLSAAMVRRDHGYLLSAGRLFEYSVQPLRFGDEATGTLLGYVIGGQTVNAAFLNEVSSPASAQALFLSGTHVLVSTLPLSAARQPRGLQTAASNGGNVGLLVVNGTHYLAMSSDLSGDAAMPLRLVLLKSLAESEQDIRDINRNVTAIGLLAFLVGSLVMLALAKGVTAPLEQLTRSVRAFGRGDASAALPSGGTREVRLLSANVAGMRQRITETSRALLEAERLATIGRMASSISHDIRHYLAAVYANAEFLAAPGLTKLDREALLAEITVAVHGTTELIDSLLIFSRTGYGVQRTAQRFADLMDRAVLLLRAHPDADGIDIRIEFSEAHEATTLVDAKQIERALYNLLLNACQSARVTQNSPAVLIRCEITDETVSIFVIDNGPGVPAAVRENLFEPFVSEGKQKGTGLGLTLTQSIAKEHGGHVRLVASVPGETIFSFTVRRRLSP